MPPKLKLRIERFLYKKGFTEPALRAIILAQLVFLTTLAVITLILLYFSTWALSVFLGAALIAFNFWSMSRFLLEHLPGGYSKTFLQGQLIRFFGRILLSGGVLAAALLWGASPWAILLGLVSCLALTAVIGFARITGQSKR